MRPALLLPTRSNQVYVKAVSRQEPFFLVFPEVFSFFSLADTGGLAKLTCSPFQAGFVTGTPYTICPGYGVVAGI